ENPARWKGHLSQILPTLVKKGRVVHHKAMPFAEVPAFVAQLRERSGVSARCLEFTILTAARTGESIKARSEEFDLDKATWTIPASRMKAKKEHRVPLSLRAVEIVREQTKGGSQWIFPSTYHEAHRGKHISNMTMLELVRGMKLDITVHGFRSSFRDWA